MEGSDSDDLDDGLVIPQRHQPERHTQREEDKLTFLKGSLSRELHPLEGTCSWLGHRGSTISICFPRKSLCWFLEIRVDVEERTAHRWGTVSVDYHKSSSTDPQLFTEAALCLKYLIQMIRICSKYANLSNKLYRLYAGHGFPHIGIFMHWGRGFPVAIINVEEDNSMNRCSKVQVNFDVDETMWAKVEVTTRDSPSTHTSVCCKDERDTFNHILSSMDLGLDLDYYQLLGKP